MAQYYLKESTDLYAVGSARADAQAKLEDPARGTAKCVQCKSSGVTLDDFVVCSECGVRFVGSMLVTTALCWSLP